MDAQRVDMFMMSHGSHFPEEKIMFIRERLAAVDDSKWGIISSLNFKDPTTALIISVFVGYFGIDRLYLGDTGVGIAKLLTCGGCYVWWLIDLFLIMGATREKNYAKLITVL